MKVESPKKGELPIEKTGADTVKEQSVNEKEYSHELNPLSFLIIKNLAVSVLT